MFPAHNHEGKMSCSLPTRAFRQKAKSNLCNKFHQKDQDITSLPKQALFETSISGSSSCLAAKIPDALKNPVGVEAAGSPAILTKPVP
jgi:hypothetical protein